MMDSDIEGTADDRVTVLRAALPVDVIDKARAQDAMLVVLPGRRAEDGRGIYGEASLFLVKELRAANVNAAYLDPPKQRLFEVKESAWVDALVSIGLGIVTNAAWDAVKAVLRRLHTDDQLMEIRYADVSAAGDQTEWTVRGPAGEVLNAVDRLRQPTAAGLDVTFPTAGDTFPTEGADSDLLQAYLQGQADSRRRIGDELLSRARALLRTRPTTRDRHRAEQDARQGLEHYARSLDWVEGTSEEQAAHDRLVSRNSTVFT
jgi:hypothetical protein